jgi:hypothetical protein
MCRANYSRKLTDSPQILHEKSLSSLCMFMCLVTFLWSENLLLHIAHLNGFRDTCVCSCIFTEELIQNVTALDIYVLQYLSKMTKLNKSGGPDGISNHILKMCADYVQWRAARLVSSNFQDREPGAVTSVIYNLKWGSLEQRRAKARSCII